MLICILVGKDLKDSVSSGYGLPTADEMELENANRIAALFPDDLDLVCRVVLHD